MIQNFGHLFTNTVALFCEMFMANIYKDFFQKILIIMIEQVKTSLIRLNQLVKYEILLKMIMKK